MYNSVFIYGMPSSHDYNPKRLLTGHEPLHALSKGLNHVMRETEYPDKTDEIFREKAAWCLRISKRETCWFRLKCAGALAMSAAIAPLSVCGAVNSLNEGRIGGIAISAMTMLWCLNVGRETVQDLNSPDYRTLLANTAQARMNYDATMASTDVTLT
jgi:hypothetical protein